jgi:hypothetical protein
VVLATLAVGLPIFFVLAIRFLWERKLSVGRSKELEKLIWQLHRVASALEHQMNLSFPAVQPGTEEPSDLVYMQQPPNQAKPALRSAARAGAMPSAGTQAAGEQAQHAANSSGLPAGTAAPSGGDATRHGVNSMFGL